MQKAQTEMEVDDSSSESSYDDGQKRLDFILQQAEIYAHFVAKGDGKSPQKGKSPKVVKKHKK